LVSSVSSLKFGGSIAFILVIVGESLVSVEKSLGYLLSSYQNVMVMARPQFWLTTIIISVLALIIFFMCSFLNKLTRTNE
jgi:ABC-type nitrate/sulfonate/bicarbonate transport system permease component